MIDQIQLYISKNTEPYENLATEKYLLDTTPAGCCTLYLWQNQNTVVIGKNQNAWAECRCALLEEEGGRLARRLSGGGAVFHDIGNLNFTFLCATEDYDLAKQMEVIRTACERAGIPATVSGRNDILADGRKFSGNAFYNAKGRSYHHGTLLIAADTEKMGRYLTPPKAKLEAKGVKSVRSRVVNLSELAPDLTCAKMKEHMIAAFEQVYGLAAERRTELDAEAITRLAAHYGSWEYLYGSPLPFTFSCEERFPWGNLQLQLQIQGGIILAAKLYTDAMDHTLPEQAEAALCGIPFDPKAMEAALAPLPHGEDLWTLLEKQAF